MVTQQPQHTDLILDISSRTELLGEARAFVTDAARAFGFPADDIAKIELAVDEACTNIIKHAYRNDPAGHIRLVITSSASHGQPRRFIITITDTGVAFDAAAYRMPDMSQYLQKPRRGGLGIVLMNKLMDEVDYAVTPDESNAIRLVKYL